MKSRIAIGSWLLVAALVGCGDDSSSSSDAKDAGTDGGENASGTGGQGGKGGQSGGGKGGESAGGVGGDRAGGNGGGGSGGNGNVTYSIAGEATGLKGSGLVLLLNDANDLSVTKDGGFVFDKELGKDEDYRVSVKTQPKNPVQACSVTDGEGKVGEENIESVKIICSDVSRSIGGNITGLGGGQIVLKNNNGDDLTVTQDGTFTFHTTLKPAAGYEVTIGTLPNARTCSLTKAKGTLGDSNITDVTIACYEGLTLAARPRPGSVGLTWNGNGATSYTVYASTAKDCNWDDPDSCAGHAKKENVTSPYVWSDLENGKAQYFSVRGNHPDSFVTHSTGAGARPNEAAFDKDVNAIARGGDGTIYIGGSFSSVGAYTGPVVPVDKSTGLPSRLADFPIFPGSISSVISDGAGGYFVAGKFALEISGSNTINNLAHVLNTGAVDPTWKPEPGPDGTTVRAIALQGTTLYLTGNFTTVGTGGSNARNGLAAVSTTGPGTLSAWNPAPVPSGSVDAIVANATTVYVGGRFTNIGANSSPLRAGLAAIDPANGNATSWDPSPSLGGSVAGEVSALALSTDTLYVGGNFDAIGGASHSQLAAVGLTGTGTATAFTATLTTNAPPTTLGLTADVLYVGGNFTVVNSEPRNRLAGLNTATGALATWNPNADAVVQELAVSGDTIYVAGDFQNIAGKARKYVAAIDKQGALVESWDPRPNAATTTIAADNDTVYVGGGNSIVTFGAEQYARLAAIKGSSLSTWSAAVSGGDVLALAVSGTNIYFGGDFTKVGTSDRVGAAALTEAAALSDWNANLDATASVHALAATSDTLYLGGKFTLGSRVNLAALNTSDAAVHSGWTSPTISGRGNVVNALALDSGNLYVGGDFTTVASNSHPGVVSLNAGSGARNMSFTGNADDVVHALAVVGNLLFVGGEFAQLGGVAHPALGALSTTSGAPDSWEPAVAADPIVRALATGAGGALYVGGQFSTVGPLLPSPAPSNSWRGLVVLQSASPFGIIPGGPQISGTSVNALLSSGANLYVGGIFGSVGGNRGTNFIATDFTPPP